MVRPKLFQNKLSLNSRVYCGFGGKNKTQSFQNFFAGDIFVHLLNIFATAVPKSKQNIKNYSSILTIVNHRDWLDDHCL